MGYNVVQSGTNNRRFGVFMTAGSADSDDGRLWIHPNDEGSKIL
jgi:hypothetical protein